MYRILTTTLLIGTALLGLVYFPIAPVAGPSFAEMGERAGVENVQWEESAGNTVLQLLEQTELSKILLSDEVGRVKKTRETLGRGSLGLDKNASALASLQSIATWSELSQPMWGQRELGAFNSKEQNLFALLWDSCPADSPVWTGYARLLVGQLQHGDPVEVATSVNRISFMLESSATWSPETLAVFDELPDNWLTQAVLREYQCWEECGMFDFDWAELVVKPSRFDDLRRNRLWQQFFVDGDRFMMSNAELLLELENCSLERSDQGALKLNALSNDLEDFVELNKHFAKLR